jgi:aminodeoxyfutalosine synthase
MVKTVQDLGDEITEVHIVGAVHPHRDIHYYSDLIRRVREVKPSVHIKAFTAIELEYMINKAGLSLEDGLQLLKDAGLDSIPGGGAEIFDEEIRSVICGQKSTSEAWLQVHEAAHRLGIPSNATILYWSY